MGYADTLPPVNTRHLKNPANVPRKGWLARQPETGTVIKGLSLRGLIDEVVKYRTANGLPIEPNTRRMVENQICETMEGEEACHKCRFLEENDEKNPKHLRAWNKTLTDLVNFATAVKGTLAAKLAGKEIHVSREEANRRAVICSQCRHNLPIASCWGCSQIGKLHMELAGNLHTDKDSLLESCGVCGCSLRLKVWFTRDVLKPVSENQGFKAEDFPAWCWIPSLLGEKGGL